MSRPALRPQGPCPTDRAFASLLRALRPHVGAHRLIAATSRAWASATFLGARHRLAIVLLGDDAALRAERLQAMLAEADLPIGGGFVADIELIVRMEADQPVIAIEALTIEEGGSGGGS